MIKFNKVDFVGSHKDIEKMPKDGLPEVAFLGRSNVGKSTLLNNLCRVTIAQTSSTPGKTKLLNFFRIDNLFYLVDMPGYGYAKIPKEMKKEWDGNIEGYLANRKELKIAVMLLDIRREPGEHDMMIHNWLKQLKDVIPIYVLTKVDKLKASEINKNKAIIAKALFVSQLDFILYSSTKNVGRKELLARLSGLFGV